MTKTDFVKIRLNKHMILYVDIPEELTIVESTALFDCMNKIQKIIAPSLHKPLTKRSYVRTRQYFKKEYDKLLITLKNQKKSSHYIAEKINETFGTTYSAKQIDKRWWNIRRKKQ
ncbi:MAG: hypothetical protein R3321_05125 [Nitrososphaeraceae archaeon]|nr:hypothetical protein [Nitrososphaeraceae archaeon]